MEIFYYYCTLFWTTNGHLKLWNVHKSRGPEFIFRHITQTYLNSCQMNMASKRNCWFWKSSYFHHCSSIPYKDWACLLSFLCFPSSTRTTVWWIYVCTFSAVYLHICLCVFVDIQSRTPLLSAERLRMGVKPSCCCAEWLARQWVVSWVFKMPNCPLLSPWDCLVSKHTTTSLQGICRDPHPSLLPPGLCVYICMWECSCMPMRNWHNYAASLWYQIDR